MYRVSPYMRHFAKALVGGALIATAWVNIDPASYYDAIEFRLADLPLPVWTGVPPVTLSPLNLVSEALMALFMFFIGKELWEALVLERGALAGRARASMPLGAVIGGLVGAVLVWLVFSGMFETAEEAGFGTGWPVPLGSDVVLCYVFGRAVFGRDHPALHLLLLITIAFDIFGLVILGLANPEAELRMIWLLLTAAAMALAWVFHSRLARPDASERQHRRAYALWPYLLTGGLSWAGVALSGLPGALGLLPMIPVIPHAERSFGLFAEAEEFLKDPLNRLARLMVHVLPVVLFLFGLTRGGVDFGAIAPTTGSVLAALWLGKPLGLLAGALVAGALTGTLLPRDLRLSDLLLIAVLSGTGFTVPVLALDSALPGGAMAEAARLGLALSLIAGPFALGLKRLIRR
jgi:NhaA family Na+:H+ antiporter